MGKGLLIIAFIFVGFFSKAQQEDAMVWAGIGTKLDITKDLRFDYESQVRFYKNASTLGQYYNEFSLKYELLKGFDASVSYRYSRKNKESNFIGENRFCLNLSYGYRIDAGLKFSGRARYQHVFERLKVINNTIYPNISSLFRFKFETSYENSDFKRVQPFVSTEWFAGIQPKGLYGLTDTYRFSTGVDLDLPAKNEVKLAYIYEKEFRSTEVSNHIFVIQYKYYIPYRVFDKKGN